MAFAAPMAVENVAAAGAAGGAGASASAAGGAGAATSRAGAAAAGRGASSKAAGSKTAAGRADELVAGGGPRYRQRRALQDELGATAAQADDLLDAAGSRAPAPDAGDASSPEDAKPSAGEQLAGSVRRQASKGVGGAVNGAGGLFFGVLTYVLALTYLRGGMPAVKDWLAAKFLNRTPGSAAPSPSAPAPATGGGSNLGSGLYVAGQLGPDGSVGVGASGGGVSSSGGGGW